MSESLFVLMAACGVAAFVFPAIAFRLNDDLHTKPATDHNSPTGKSAPRKPSLDLENLDADAVEQASQAFHQPLASTLKRGLDVLYSIVLLLVTAPLLAVVALTIKLDSQGPIFYTQERVGLGGRTFNLIKFRSMRLDAEKDGAQYSQVGDSRITRVGRIIRRLRIDEIPQTFNVLQGEMSFIGPRPERPEFISGLESEIAHYHHRHLVKPGITGWAQVKHEYTATVAGARQKLAFDLYYIRHFSFLMDISILFQTVRVAVFGLGSR